VNAASDAQLKEAQMITMVNRTMRRAILKLLKMRGMWGGFACSRADQESVCTSGFLELGETMSLMPECSAAIFSVP
jgi:hypothetical protein